MPLLSVMDAEVCCPALSQDGAFLTQLPGVLAASGWQLHQLSLPWPRGSRLPHGPWPLPEQPVANGALGV